MIRCNYGFKVSLLDEDEFKKSELTDKSIHIFFPLRGGGVSGQRGGVSGSGLRPVGRGRGPRWNSAGWLGRPRPLAALPVGDGGSGQPAAEGAVLHPDLLFLLLLVLLLR